MRTATSQLVLFSATLLFAASSVSCGLISKDFEGKVRVEASVDDDDKDYKDILVVNPNEKEDVRNNRDKVESGEVVNIIIEILRVNAQRAECASDASQCGQFIVGQIDVRPTVDGQGEEDNWLMAIGRWDGVALQEGNSFKVVLPADTQKQLNSMIFDSLGSVDVRINGFADRGPVSFDFAVTVELRFTATL